MGGGLTEDDLTGALNNQFDNKKYSRELRLSTGCSELGEFMNGQDFFSKNYTAQSIRNGGEMGGPLSSAAFDDNHESAT